MVRPGGSGKRYSLKADLACPEPADASGGERSWSVVLPVTKLDHGTSFRAYFDAAMEVSGERQTFRLLVHEKADFAIGKATRQDFEKAKNAGKVRLFAFQEHRLAFEEIECLLRLLDKAAAGDLSLGGKTIPLDECRRLMMGATVLEGFELFEAMGGWAVP